MNPERYDPLTPPPEAIRRAARLLVAELGRRGARITTAQAPDGTVFVTVTGSRCRVVIEVRGWFYTWDDPHAAYGNTSHALWDNPLKAATRAIQLTSPGPAQPTDQPP